MIKNRALSWASPKIEVKKTLKCGRGIFAKKNIKKNEVITIYGGYIISVAEFRKLPIKMHDYPYHISDNFLFGPIKEEEIFITEYYNHSCNPNAGFKDSLTLVAIRDIDRGEEITFDYAFCMTSSILNMKCFCGTKNCRKIIMGSDWKKPYLQKKYKNYFQPYIQEKIKNKK